MKKYHKYIIKDIGKLLPKLLAIVLIVILGVSFTVGLLTAAPNMRYSVEKHFDKVNAADIIIQGKPFSIDILEKIKESEYIEDAFGFYSFDSDVEFKNGMHLANINVIDFNNVYVNKLTLVEGRFPKSSNEVIEIVIERNQPFLIDVPLGYETQFLDKTVKVVGIVNNPWHFAFVEEISQLSQRPIEIIIYAGNNLLEKVEYTHIAATLKEAKGYDTFSDDYEEFVDEKLDLLKIEYKDYYFTPRYLNQSFAKYKSDVKIIEAIAFIFPLFFLLITILVSMASITRIVEDQRGQIGTLRSLGYGKFKIMSKYILYALISSGIGAIVGIGLGVYFIPAIAYNAYGIIYNLPPFSIQYYVGITSIITLTMIISVVLVTIGSVMQTLNEKPIELLKVKTQKPGKKIFFERITFIWKRLKFKYKSTLRNILRHKNNLILTILGISGSTALLLAGFGVKDSVDLAGKYQFDEMMQYNLELNTNPTNESFQEIKGYYSIYIMSSNAQYLNKDYISIIVPKDTNMINDFITFREDKNQEFNMKNDSVIVTKQFSMKHNLEVGDIIYLKVNDKEIGLKITNIQEYYFGNNIYISKDLIEDLIDIKYNKIYVKIDTYNTNLKTELKEQLDKNENILKVMFHEDLKYTFKNTSKSMNSVIIVLLVSAGALAIIVNYNLTLINVHTRKREIATLKVLGYQEVEVSGYVFRETVIVSTTAILIGLLVGKGLHYFIISRIVIDGILLYNDIYWLSYLYTTFASFIFLVIVYFISFPQTKKVNMIDALKSYE